jgi:spermidine/putrescine transport system substrate-binding protein
VLQVKNRKNPNIEYVFPKEGGELFVDSLAIPKGAASPEIAKQFMRFTLDQAIALTQVKHLFYSPVVDLRGVAGSQDILSNPVVVPSDPQLSKFEVMLENPKRIEAIQKLWTELKSM